MSYLSAFDLRAGEANYGKIFVSNNDPMPAGTETAFVQIEAPTGIIKAFDLSTPDIDLGAADNSLLVDIPVDANGDWITGEYTITVQDSHPVYGARTFLYEFDFCPLLGTPALSFEVQCVCAKAVVEDDTVYGEGATVTRTMTIIPPTIPGEAAPSNITTSSSSYTLDLDYANVKYQVNLEVSVNSEPVSGVTVLEEISYAQWFDVICDYDLCSLITCVNRDLADIEAKAARVGGYKNLATSDFDKLIGINQLLFKHNNLVTCENWSGVQSVYQELLDLIDCDCGCSSSTSSGPVAISSACSGGASSLAISATTPITATLVGSTWQIAFSSSYKATLDLLRRYNVISTDASLSVSKSYDAGSNVETVDVELTTEDWNLLDHTDFTTDFTPNTPVSYPTQLGYRVALGQYVEIFGQMRLDKTISLGSHNILGTVLTADYRPTNNSNWFPMLGPDGTIAGNVRLNNTGQIETYIHLDWAGAGWSASSYVSFHFLVPKDTPVLI